MISKHKSGNDKIFLKKMFSKDTMNYCDVFFHKSFNNLNSNNLMSCLKF